MNFSNPLLPIWQAYKTTQDSFIITKRAIKTNEPKTKQRLLQRTDIENKTIIDAERLIDELMLRSLLPNATRILRKSKDKT